MNLAVDFSAWQSALKHSKLFANANSSEFKGHQDKIQCVRWSVSGRHLASGSFDKSLKIWSITEGNTTLNECTEYAEHSDSISQISWNRTNEFLLTAASTDKSFSIYDVRSKQCVQTIATGGENININWAPDGNFIGVASKLDQLRIYDTRMMKIIFAKDYAMEVNEFDWSSNMHDFILSTGRGEFLVNDGQTFLERQHVFAHTSNCFCLRMESKGRYFVTGGADSLVMVWDLQSFSPLQSFCSASIPIRALAISHDANYIGWGCEDKLIEIGRVDIGDSFFKIPTSAPVVSLDWHPNNFLLCYAEDNGEGSSKNSNSLKIFGLEGLVNAS